MVKTPFLTFAASIATLLATPASAQGFLDLPRESQRAMVQQRIGVTDLTIRYHRPLVKGRKIWGTLVPYGDVWRAGANENTTFECSDPITVEGHALAKGTYGLHMIPGEKEWTVIFSKSSQAWGSYTYSQAEDALRVTVKPKASELHEALAYDFDDLKPASAVVALRWEKLAVPFKVEVNVNDTAVASLRNQVRGFYKFTWEGWDEAANYLLDNKGSTEEALADANQSIAVEERFDNLMTRAKALDALGKKDEAAASRAKALPIGSPLQLHSYGRELQGKGQQEQAFEIFRTNIKRNPDHWLAHNEAARIACSKKDFEGAVKEMKTALTGAPSEFKGQVQSMIKRLEAKEDINK